jgi:hypothetical protein
VIGTSNVLNDHPTSRRRPALRRLATVLVTLVLCGCAQSEKGILDFELVREAVDGTGPFRIAIDSSNLDTFFQTTRQTRAQMWVGQQPSLDDLVVAKSLLRFAVSLPAEAEADSVKLKLYCAYGGDYGIDDEQRISVESVHAVEPKWWEDTSVDYPFDDHSALSPPVEFGVTICADDPDEERTEKVVTLPASLVQSWIDDPDTNNGIILDPRSVGAFKRFEVSETRLEIYYRVNAEEITATLTAAAPSDIQTD